MGKYFSHIRISHPLLDSMSETLSLLNHDLRAFTHSTCLNLSIANSIALESLPFSILDSTVYTGNWGF